MKLKTVLVLAVAMLPLLCAGVAFGQLIEVDEFGHSNFQPGFIGNDPGPGGLNGVLIYPLPFAGTQGDVGMQDGAGGPVLDYIRFNGNGTLIFYSDNVDGADAPADTPSPPGQLYPNLVIIQEVGNEGGIEDAFYRPQPGQPGFEADFPNLTYHFISDVPEPATLTMLATGSVALGVLAWSRRRRKLTA